MVSQRGIATLKKAKYIAIDAGTWVGMVARVCGKFILIASLSSGS